MSTRSKHGQTVVLIQDWRLTTMGIILTVTRTRGGSQGGRLNAAPRLHFDMSLDTAAAGREGEKETNQTRRSPQH